MPAASFSCLSHDVKVVGISQFVYLENISIKSKHVFSVHFVRLCSCLISLKNSSRVCLFGGLTFGFVGTAGLARSVMCSGVLQCFLSLHQSRVGGVVSVFRRQSWQWVVGLVGSFFTGIYKLLLCTR